MVRKLGKLQNAGNVVEAKARKQILAIFWRPDPVLDFFPESTTLAKFMSKHARPPKLGFPNHPINKRLDHFTNDPR
jgi:hypothetical protein